MEDEEVPLVDGVFKALEIEALVDAMEVRIAEASRFDARREDHHLVQKKWECRIVGNRENDVFAFDGVVMVNTLKLKKLRNLFRSRKIGMILSFGFLGVYKRTKILFVCEDGLAIEWNSEDLTKLFEGESDKFVLNNEGDKNEAGVIYLKSDLTIKVQNKTRDNWLNNFVETIKAYVRKTTIDVIRCVVKLINDSTLMNASIFDRCGDSNHLIGECPKSSRNKNQRAFIGGAWSDSGEDEEEKNKDKTCLVAQASNDDRGKARHSVSSTSAHHNRGSSSRQGDDDEDDGASRASTPSPTTYLNSLKPLDYQQYDIPTSSEQDDDLLFERQTDLLNQTQQMHKELRGGFKLFGKALRGVFGKKKK
ncbi:hypothetical protein Tco_0795541 [Tanacetum coccineum]